MIRRATAIEAVNLALRFTLEMGALLALGYWAFGTTDRAVLKVLFGISVPLLAALLWGAYISPKAIARLDDPLRLCVEMLFFAASSVALAARLGTAIGLGVFIMIMVNIALLFLLGQRGR